MGRPDGFHNPTFKHNKVAETAQPQSAGIKGRSDEHLQAGRSPAFDAKTSKSSEHQARRTYNTPQEIEALYLKYLKETPGHFGIAKNTWEKLSPEARHNWAKKYADDINQTKTFKDTCNALGIPIVLAVPKTQEAIPVKVTTSSRGIIFKTNTAMVSERLPNGTLKPVAYSEQHEFLGITRQKTKDQSGTAREILGLGSAEKRLTPVGQIARQAAKDVSKEAEAIRRESNIPRAVVVNEHTGQAVGTVNQSKSGNRAAANVKESPQKIINDAYDAAGVSRKDFSDEGFEKVAKYAQDHGNAAKLSKALKDRNASN